MKCSQYFANWFVFLNIKKYRSLPNLNQTKSYRLNDNDNVSRTETEPNHNQCCRCLSWTTDMVPTVESGCCERTCHPQLQCTLLMLYFIQSKKRSAVTKDSCGKRHKKTSMFVYTNILFCDKLPWCWHYYYFFVLVCHKLTRIFHLLPVKRFVLASLWYSW